MDPESYLYIGAAFFVVSVVMSLLPSRKSVATAYALSAVGAVSLAAFGLSGNVPDIPSIPVSSMFEFSFAADGLSSFFIIVVSILAVPTAIYSIGYTKDIGRRGLLGGLFNLFILSMYAVVLSANVITFLVSWETMSVVSYFLVTHDRKESSAKAGLLYAAMTHVGTAFIIILFLLLYKHTGHMDFAGMKAAASGIPEGVKTAVFVLSIAGFGTKAGIIPLHTWLPRAHPAAPSNISALMSGVMIKTGIYGFLRIAMDVMGQGPGWWGIAVIVIGAVSSVLGVLYALMEHDIKRLLAYHSIENIGIILLGIGAALMFRADGSYALAGIALAAGLYHTLNHAVFKGLLFLGAGAVVHATGTQNMEEMGGLLKKMPYTGFFFLIGSVSICALPPFNGFVSEWLTFQALLLGFDASSVTSKIISPLGGAALALTGALAAACFVKAFGISFLGQNRNAGEAVKDAPPSMLSGMAMLASLCLIFGIFPGPVLSLIARASDTLAGRGAVLTDMNYIYIGKTSSALSPLLLLAMFLILAIAAMASVLLVGGKRKTTYASSWDCGMPGLTPRMQYSATAFTKPLRVIFKRIYLPRREIQVAYKVKPFFVESIKYKGEITPFAEKYMYAPLTGFIRAVAAKVRLLQSGDLHLYLGYILITMILLLIFAT